MINEKLVSQEDNLSDVSATPLQHPASYHSILLPMIPGISGKTVVDVGCGKGVWGFLVRASHENHQASTFIGLDAHRPYLEFSRRYRVYDEMIVGSIDYLPLKEKVAEVVIAIEVVEHLSPPRSRAAIEELSRVASETIILTTPNGLLEIKHPGTGMERHLSAWRVQDLRELGFSVRGYGLRGAWKLERYSKALASFLRWTMTPLSFLIPEFAEYLIALKRTSKR